MKFYTNDAKTPEELEGYLIFFEPEGRLERLIKTGRDIYEHRTVLKQIPSSDFTVGYLARIVRDALEAGKPFRFVDCVKVIRAIIVSHEARRFNPAVVADLFEIYKARILSVSEPVQWCLSRIVKGQVLSEDAVQWLLDNQRRSPHIVNRLLDYPEGHPKIEAWAVEMYANGELRERLTDLLALLIHDSVPPVLKEGDPAAIIWAIFRSRTHDEVKKQLLKEHALKAPAAALEVAMRTGWRDIVTHMIAEARRAG
jgi:hypothetical protein